MGDGHLKHFPIAEARREGGDTFVATDREPGFAFRTGFEPVLKRDVRYTQYLYFPRTGVLGGLRFKVSDIAARTAR